MKNAMMKFTVLGTALIAGSLKVMAQAQDGSLDAANDIYNNSYVTPSAGLSIANGQTVGNEIFAAGNANDNYMTNFTFEYYGVGGGPGGTTFSGNVQIEVAFYANNGPAVNGYLSPSATPFYVWNSANYSDLANAFTPGNEVQLTLGIGDPEGLGGAGNIYLDGVFLPSREFTYAITVTGLGAGDSFGLSSAAGSAIGTVYSGYWNLPSGGGSWEYLTNGVDDASLAEVQAVPEPTSLALVGLAGLAGLAAAKRKFSK